MPTPSKAVQILALLAQSPSGLRFGDIQKAAWALNHPGPVPARVSRGYWCTNLLGLRNYHRGILRVYAERGADGRWRRNSVPVPRAGAWSGV